MYSITRKSASPRPALVRRFTVRRDEIAKAIGEGLGSVFGFAKQHGVELVGPPFARYSDVGPEGMTIEPGMFMAPGASASAEGDVSVETLPGGTLASTIHERGYETLHEAYAAIEAWIKDEGLTATGAPWEIYLTDPETTPKADWRTEVCWPVK